MMQKRDSNSSQQSVERALKLLKIMGESKTPMNVTEISKALHISRSTAYAMLHVMTNMNFLSKNQETGKYFLGYNLFILGSVSRLQYSYIFPCDDYLRTFMAQFTMQANAIGIWILEQDYHVLRFIIKKPNAPSFGINQIDPRRLVPAFCTASGKVLLADLSNDKLTEALSKQDIRPYTASTITDISQLKRQLDAIHHQGYGVDVEEYSNFEVNIAAPIRDYSGKAIAAVNISVSKLLYQNKYQEYIQLALGLGQEMSALMGYHSTS